MKNKAISQSLPTVVVRTNFMLTEMLSFQPKGNNVREVEMSFALFYTNTKFKSMIYEYRVTTHFGKG